MEAALIEALKQAPSLAVLTYLVITGLKHAQKVSNNFTQTLKDIEEKRSVSQKQARDDCHTVQREGHSIMKEVKNALHQNTKMLGFVSGARSAGTGDSVSGE